jgi:flagellar FliJ protein
MAARTFRFRLERLLDIRIMREKQARQELLARQAQLAVEEQRLEVLNAEAAALQERMTPRAGEVVDFDEIRLCSWALKAKEAEQEEQRQRIAAAHQRVLEQQDVVRERGIEVKALEKLKEKQREEFNQELLAEQAVFLDDLASQQFIRREAQQERLAAEQEQAL